MKISFSLPFLVFALILLIFISPILLFVYFASVILHEFAHSKTAMIFNSKLDNIRLYPFGAIIFGNYDNLQPIEEIIVALSGVVFNAFIALMFIATWWIIPESYNYTHQIVYVNISLSLFNLLPIYPLDGGKVMSALLSIKYGHYKSIKILKTMGIIFSCMLFLAFVVSIFIQINFTYLTTSLLLFYSAFDKKSNLCTKRLDKLCLSQKDLEKCPTIRHIAVSCELTIFDIYRRLNPDYFYIIYVYDDKLRNISRLDTNQFQKILTNNSINEKICLHI